MTFSQTAVMALTAFAALGAALDRAAAADDYSQWPKTDSLYLNTTPDGANVTGTVLHFPLLVRLDGTHFNFAQAKGKGQDIRFSKADGTHLRYQVDRWDSAHAMAEIWVLMDTVYGNKADQLLRMHWGNNAAADSSRGDAVFKASDGFVAAWHLGLAGGAGDAPRPNSVAGGFDATPTYFDGGETTAGMIGLADSLDGNGQQGDYFDVGVGYQDFTSGFTYSVWVYPTAADNYSRLLDLGNGPRDEIVVQRNGTSNGISFLNYNGTTAGKTVTVDNAFPVNQWQYFTFTVSGSTAKIYRNGALVGSDDLGNTISNAVRPYNYLGHSDWSGNAFFQGILDEPVLASAARSADWIKLSYASQSRQPTLISYAASVPPVLCTARFSVPADTAMPEGGILSLPGVADCADNYSWSIEAGPAPKILDPENKVLQVFLPRISHDTLIEYRFTAVYGDSTRNKVVRITVKETIPDPIFTLPKNLIWNGTDSLLIQPSISDLAAIKASAQPDLRYAWTIANMGNPGDMGEMAADTVWRDTGMMLKSAQGGGTMAIGLCLDNNGPQVCATMSVEVTAPTSLARASGSRSARAPVRGFDARGRRLVGMRGNSGSPLTFSKRDRPLP